MDAIIEHLRETYALSTTDLALPDDERNFLMGQLAMIDEVADLLENGIPTKEDEA